MAGSGGWWLWLWMHGHEGAGKELIMSQGEVGTGREYVLGEWGWWDGSRSIW